MVLVISVFLVQYSETDMASADSTQGALATKAKLDAIQKELSAADNKLEELKADMDKIFQNCQQKSKQHSYLYAFITKISNML